MNTVMEAASDGVILEARTDPDASPCCGADVRELLESDGSVAEAYCLSCLERL